MFNQTKKAVQFLSSILLAFALSGCGGGSSDDTTTNTNSVETTQESTDNNPTLSTEELPQESTATLSSMIPHTNQKSCFDSTGDTVSCDGSGQDGAYLNNLTSYTNSGNGTVKDNVTNLVWQQTSDTNETVQEHLPVSKISIPI